MGTDFRDEFFEDFLLETSERLERLEGRLLDLEQSPGRPAATDEGMDELRRELHTLKGNAGLMGLGDLQALAHDMEESLAGLPRGLVAARELLRGVDRFRELLGAVAGGQAGGEEAGEAAGAEGVRVP
ncbi:MAG TPA: Hpt domain-containing protein, partial [Thermoanaerobaculia bacterium]